MDTTPATARPSPTVLSPGAIASLPDVPLGVGGGVTHRVLWRDESSLVGVLTIAPGARLGLHEHRRNHHHIWVIDGAAAILGHTVHAGGYVHVPAGVEHDLDATSTEGCTAFYVYEPPST